MDQSPIFAPSTMFYGFKRQADGSYANPFYIAFNDDNDALANPYGMSFVLHGDGTATMAFAFQDPQNNTMVDVNGDGTNMIASGIDVYTDELALVRTLTWVRWCLPVCLVRHRSMALRSTPNG